MPPAERALPPGLLITAALPNICPSCAHKELRVDDRGGWFKVTCQRGDDRICRWFACYEVKAHV